MLVDLPSPLHILLVEDSRHDLFALQRTLEESALNVTLTHYVQAEEALDILEQESPPPCDLIIADYKLPGMNGLDFCRHVISRNLGIPTIILTGAGTESIAVHALKNGIDDYLVKDLQQDYLRILPLSIPQILKAHHNRNLARFLAREHETIATISEMFFNGDDTEKLYQRIAQALTEGLGYPAAMIMELDAEKSSLNLLGSQGPQGLTLSKQRRLLAHTVCGQAVTKNGPVLSIDLDNDPELTCFLKGHGIRTCLSVPIRKACGETIGVLTLADTSPRQDASLHIPSLQVVANHLGQEITRRADQKKLAFEWRRCWSLLEELPTPVWLHDKDYAVRFSNRTFREAFGDQVDRPCYQLLMNREAPCACCVSPEVFASLEPFQRDCNRPINGRLYEQHHYPFEDADGTACILKMGVDITDRKQLETTLIRSKEEWERTFDAIPDIITIQDCEMRIIRANRQAHDFFEVPLGSLIGRRCYEVFRGIDQPCEGCPLPDTTADMQAHSEIMDHKNLGKFFHITSAPILEKKGGLYGLVHIAKDITDRKKLEEELFQAHKMEAIGALAGGVAHDFNNILSAIFGHTQLAQLELEQGKKPAGHLDDVLVAGQRARDLVRQILAFSRKSDTTPQSLSPYPIIKEVLKLMRASLPATIDIQTVIDPDCGNILADPTRIHQILTNLCTNALHAMEEDGGVLKVSLEEVRLDETFFRINEPNRPGPYIRLAVADTGSGIDPAILNRIFEPYFTTKASGKGTGMGLAVVFGTVQAYGGVIRVASEPGRGTQFSIYLPEIAAAADVIEPTVLPLQTGKEHILLVDDESTILSMQISALEHLGYQVTAQSNPEGALALLRERPQDFDLLMTDQTMPRLTGARLSEAALQIRPDLPIILCTGYSETIDEAQARAIGIRRFLLKPVELRDLALNVRAALDEEKTEERDEVPKNRG